jgi:SAM-dependent methyltransferase
MASADQLRGSDSTPLRQRQLARDAAQAIPCCPLCGSSATRQTFTDSGCALRVCAVCELFFTQPYPDSGLQHAMVHSGEYSAIEILDCERRYQGERHYYDRHFRFIEEECAGAASLLDVGCGTGHLLERLQARPGLRCTGIELNAQAAEFARRVSGCEVLEVPFEQFRGGQRYDVITMINVLSHIPSFDGLFRSLRTALTPGGKVIIRTSEMSARVSRWNQLHWGIPDDLHFLGLGTLDFLCAKYGFAIMRHIRTPFEEELFRRSRWRQVGRSSFVNALKAASVRIPGMLPAMKRAYAATLGQRLFVSFIVLTANADGEMPR